ncbi:MAG: structural protein MipA [Citromicrobium sp.]|nr:MAG: structural protein MipA [Citromicrobium sp.]
MKFATPAAAAAIACALALPTAALAQDSDEARVDAQVPTETVFDGDFVMVGVGVGYGASYSGSDDYTAFAVPVVAGSIAGVDFTPRAAGLAFDLIPDAEEGVSFNAGPVIKLNRDRADIDQIEDDVVAAYGELDTAIEVGPSVGVQIPQILHGYDWISISADAAWDIAGAHEGMSISPGVNYFTPLSRGMAASLGVNATWIDDDYADYYYSVSGVNPGLSKADLLPAFDAEGGFERIGVNAFLAYDLNNDLTDGGLAIVGLGSYSRLLGDAKDTPFTSIRGDANQWLFAAGIGYTF